MREELLCPACFADCSSLIGTDAEFVEWTAPAMVVKAQRKLRCQNCKTAHDFTDGLSADGVDKPRLSSAWGKTL